MAPRGGAWLALAAVLAAALVAKPLAQATYPSEYRFSWCMGPQCHDNGISAAHFQLKLAAYYGENRRPPLREAFFIVTLPPSYLKELFYGCPGMVVLAYLLVAEARVHTHGSEEAAELVRRAETLMAMPEVEGPHLEGIHNAWPLAAATDRFRNATRLIAAARPQTLDIVLPRCTEELSWLQDWRQLGSFPAGTRIFVYEKCGQQAAVVPPLTADGTSAQVVQFSLPDAIDPNTGLAARRDECTAYLAHVVNQYSAGIADFTLFLHGDPSDHTPLSLLSAVLRSLAMGSLRDVDFLHLGSPRLVQTANPCQLGLFEAAMGRAQHGPLSTYCCSQFGVSRERILSRPVEEYHRMYGLVDGTYPDLCTRIGPSYERYAGARLSHCFFFEFMWHVVFGEREALPLRSDDVRLPVALRLKDSEEMVPSAWRSYMKHWVGGQASFYQQGYDSWLSAFRSASQVEGVQRNYGDPEDG